MCLELAKVLNILFSHTRNIFPSDFKICIGISSNNKILLRFQGLFAMFGLFVCRSEHVDERGQSSGPHRRENAPSWPIIIGFTIVFLATYPLHMYVAEVYLSDPGSSFAFLIAKVC